MAYAVIYSVAGGPVLAIALWVCVTLILCVLAYGMRWLEGERWR